MATRPGLFHGNFVLPDGIVPGRDAELETYLDDLPHDVLAKFGCAGDLAGCQEVLRYAKGNSRFILCFGQGVAAIVAAITSNETAAIGLTGPAGAGKSALAGVASSPIWGRHPDAATGDRLGFAEPWAHTLNNLEPILSAHSDMLLVLDETRNTGANAGAAKQAQQVLDAAMKIEGGIAKGRLTDPGPRRTWHVPVISTSNLSVVELLSAANKEFEAAYADRLIDIPPPAEGFGMFETLHGYTDLASFVRHLKGVTAENYGHLGPAFVQYVLAYDEVAHEELIEWIEERRAAYLKRARKIVSTRRDLTRIHGRFATIYAALCLAGYFELFPFTRRECLDAILKCEADHVSFIETEIAKLSGKQPLELLREYVAANEAKFVDLSLGLPDLDSHPPSGVPGYFAERDDEKYLYFRSQLLDEIVGGKDAGLRLKQELHARGADSLVESWQGRRTICCKKIYWKERGRTATRVRHWHSCVRLNLAPR